MDMKRLAIGTIAGAIVWDLVNYIVITVLAADFYAANLGSATGIFRDETLQWSVALGSLALGALMTACIMSRPDSASVTGATITGAIISFAVWFHADFVIYGFTNMFNLTLTIADAVLSAIPGACAGAVIAMVLSRVPKSATA